MATPDRTAVRNAYRHLYRGALEAVQYSKPARYIARNQIRAAFRKDDPSTFDQHKINRTVEFLKYAARERGLEHKLVKNLLHTKYATKEEAYMLRSAKTDFQRDIRKTNRTHYDMTLAMLNDSMGLCLR